MSKINLTIIAYGKNTIVSFRHEISERQNTVFPPIIIQIISMCSTKYLTHYILFSQDRNRYVGFDKPIVIHYNRLFKLLEQMLKGIQVCYFFV